MRRLLPPCRELILNGAPGYRGKGACMDGTDEARVLSGRLPVTVDYEAVDRDNVLAALADALPAFGLNAGDIDYLWRYYRGLQPILDRVKDVRPEICNKVVVNIAQEVVAFKIGYQLEEPLQYACRMPGDGDDGAYERTLVQVNELNTLMFAEDKASCDRDLFEWMCIGGTGFRMAEADRDADRIEGDSPFEVHTLDPRCTCVVESSAYHHRPVMAFWAGRDENDNLVYTVFTDTTCFIVSDGAILSETPHTYGAIPIVEYKLNNARMGVFEPVLPLLDAINLLESNRLDDVEQVVQALMVFKDCDISGDDFEEMRAMGAVKIKSLSETVKATIDLLKNPLDQTGVQTAKDDLYQAVVNICGMPNRNGTSGSSSDTGAAVLLRDGWTLAESHAKSYELQFKRSERRFLRVILAICRQSAQTGLDLRIRDIELTFNRRNYENILSKSQVLTTMLASGKIHPQLAFQSSGMFSDPDAAYKQSEEWVEANRERALEEAAAAAPQPASGGNPGSQAGQPEPGRGDDAA